MTPAPTPKSIIIKIREVEYLSANICPTGGEPKPAAALSDAQLAVQRIAVSRRERFLRPGADVEDVDPLRQLGMPEAIK